MNGTEQHYTLQYGEVEKAIAEVLFITAMKAFRARLRHLRNIGVPALPRPGAGHKIAFSKAMAFEMLVAVMLDRDGYPPRIVAMTVSKIAAELDSYLPHPDDIANDTYIMIATVEGGLIYNWIYKKELLRRIENGMAPVNCHLINVSQIMHRFDAALEKIMAV
jgi:hypothetical protein